MIDVHDINVVSAAAMKIEGWFAESSGRKLYRLVKKSSGDVVELGAWCGRTTVWMAAGLAARGDPSVLVWSVDTWMGTPGEHQTQGRNLLVEWSTNLRDAGVIDWAIPCRGKTLEYRILPELNAVGVLLIDADHSYESVKADFERWSPAVMVGGHVVFDDVPTHYGPTKFHRELPANWKLIDYWDNQAVFRRES